MWHFFFPSEQTAGPGWWLGGPSQRGGGALLPPGISLLFVRPSWATWGLKILGKPAKREIPFQNKLLRIHLSLWRGRLQERQRVQCWGVRVSHEASRAGFGNSRSSLEGLSRFPRGGESRAVAQRLQPFSPLLLVSGSRELGRVAAASGGLSGGRWALCVGLGPGECVSVGEGVWGGRCDLRKEGLWGHVASPPSP